MTEDEMVGWHHRLDGHEFEQALGDGDGQGSLACGSPWGRKESDVTEQLNNNHEEIGAPFHSMLLFPGRNAEPRLCSGNWPASF